MALWGNRSFHKAFFILVIDVLYLDSCHIYLFCVYFKKPI